MTFIRSGGKAQDDPISMLELYKESGGFRALMHSTR